MSVAFLDFEKRILELEGKLEELRSLSKLQNTDFSSEIRKMNKKLKQLKKITFSKLSRWQKTQLARHPARPYALDYIKELAPDWVELQGDRLFGIGPSIVAGFGTMEGRSVLFIGIQKGRETKEKMFRNFGMPHPEGYRKALRLMKLAEKFSRPVVTLLDTPGAFPGIGAEERGQAEAVARNLMKMASLTVPVVCVVTGEGGSGGALALGVGNKVLMLEHSVYSVISPEGCAAILWKDQAKVEDAAEALALTAQDLLGNKMIDEIVREPAGGAHRDPVLAAHVLKRVLRRHIDQLSQLSPQELVKQRRDRFRNIGLYFEQYPGK
ncbi:MAG: acetyl-CoA carboxylase carboxyltransferase subunit alpha [Nitrospinae bacterium]|nr:acetyl-CoA carboxylase carboxyltransferase subunit alpha [Nitrospinota bacterium]